MLRSLPLRLGRTFEAIVMANSVNRLWGHASLALETTPTLIVTLERQIRRG